MTTPKGSIELGTSLSKGTTINYPDSTTHVYTMPFPINYTRIDELQAYTASALANLLHCASGPGTWLWSFNASAGFATESSPLTYRLAGLGSGLVAQSQSGGVGGDASYDPSSAGSYSYDLPAGCESSDSSYS